jgi:voltage-gated potassium channel
MRLDKITKYFYRDIDGDSYRLVERTLEPPMLALSLMFIPVVLGPLLADMSSSAELAMELTGWAIWASFVIEYVWLLYLAPDRMVMVRTHRLDLLVVVIPFLRPLRFLRFVRLASAASGAGRAMVAFRRLGGRPGFQPFFGTVGFVIFAGAAFALAFEHEQPGATIDDYQDGLWWAFVTCTTVGYGDHFPVTSGGRVVAVVLMIVGIAGLSMLTASVAALFVEQDEEIEEVELRSQLDRIEAMLIAMTKTEDAS